MVTIIRYTWFKGDYEPKTTFDFSFLKDVQDMRFPTPDTVPAFQDDDLILEASTTKPQEQ